MNPKRILNLSINPGCNGENCKNCITKGLPTCSKVTISEMVDWVELERVIRDKGIDEVRVIGGDDPLRYCSGHLDFFNRIYKLVREKYGKKLSAVLSYKITGMTNIISMFNKIYVRMPNFDDDRMPANITWVKSFSTIIPFVIIEREVREEDILFILRSYFPKPLVITIGTEIKELRKKYPGVEFRCELYSRRSYMFSMSESKLYNTTFKRKGIKPYTELIKDGNKKP